MIITSVVKHSNFPVPFVTRISHLVDSIEKDGGVENRQRMISR